MGKIYASAILAVLLVAFIVDLIFAAPFMWLWNALMPEIFGLVKISFWQAFGLEVLAGILFGSKGVSSKVKSDD